MSLVMTDLGVSLGLADPMLSGIVTGVAGLLLMIFNYPLYRGVLGARRRKYANRVLTLSEEIQKG